MGEMPRKSFSLAMVILGLLKLLIGTVTTLLLGQMLVLKVAPSTLILAGMQVMFLGNGAILLVLCIFVLATARLTGKAR